MPSGLVASLSAPIREVAAQVGPGWSDAGDPATSLARVADLLAEVSAAARRSWDNTAEGWSGAGADGAAQFMSATADRADRLASDVDQLRATTARAADAVAWARSRLQDIVQRFEDRAGALEARLDEPGVAQRLRDEAQRALDEAVAVVDELRAELDGHAAAVSAKAGAPAEVPAGVPSGAPPTTPAGFGSPAGFSSAPAGFGSAAGFPSAPAGSTAGWGGMPGAAYSGGLSPPGADVSALPLPDPDQFGEGVAVTLPDGSTVTAPNPIAAEAVRHALTQLGVPYVWGGTTPGVGLDCSGLTQWAYHEAGLDLPRLAQEQDLGAPVSQNALRPGDLAVWDGHVAMIVGNGQMIEAGDPVQLSPIRTSNAGQGFQGFWRPTA
ncbi:glycoside hydrolase [Mycolicibacterium agri]|uniref:Glycoside hydrolase n=1 Tax=Mycolicibacterium agri TaxID=36811 RepID=A0A2A7MNV9_MYCAG|nr:C40 family peptidase [Mycolicibacterium agri]PEG33482.1 glycoside hydrolase [Mycolicibacterium agri]GFG51795.1 glycoside hydrolase [Mycolicibacterium agri]